MVKPNNEIWQWQSGFTPMQEGEVFGRLDAITYRAEDDIKKGDAVAFSGSGTTWDFTNAQTVTQKPSVVTCGTNTTDQFKFIGFAHHDADSGEAVTVQVNGAYTAKTNKAITAGDWVTPAKFGTSEKYGCVYTAANSGDVLCGQAQNDTEAPGTAGTGTTASKYNMRPVTVLMIGRIGDPLNR